MIRISDGQESYKIGQTINLMLQISSDEAVEIGNTIEVQILDVFNNLISSATAELLGEDLYAAEWIIPANINSLYNTNSEDESQYDSSYYFLKDSWTLPSSGLLEFTFIVNRSTELATKENGIITIVIDGIESVDNSAFDKTEIEFTTKLSPFYQTVDNIINVSPELSNIDKVAIVREIIYYSQWVNSNMKPNIIKNHLAFNQAIKCFIKNKVAGNLLKDRMSLISERKALDTLEIERRFDNKKQIEMLEKDAHDCALIIWAGGLSTPFVSKKFVKGLYDPNRPNVTRAKLDISNKMIPYVNVSEGQTLTIDDVGDTIEIRGIRTISSASRSLL